MVFELIISVDIYRSSAGYCAMRFSFVWGAFGEEWGAGCRVVVGVGKGGKMVPCFVGSCVSDFDFRLYI